MEQIQIDAFDNGALLRPMPELATLIVTGDERQSWLAGMLTADIKELPTGEGAYTLAVDKSGRVQAEVWVVIDDERILLGVPRSLADELLEHMDKYLIMEDADIARDDSGLAWWLAHGPGAEGVANAAREGGAVAARAKLGDIDTTIVVAPYGGAPNTAELLTNAAGAMIATPKAWERIRIMHMLPRFGVDFDKGCYPQEASLEGLAVSFNKGCYIGQEAVFMLQKRGHVSKRLVRLLIEDGVELSAGREVHDADGKTVGNITSSARAGEHTVAMGLVRYKHTLSGTELSVDGRSAKVSCLSAREES